MKDISPYWRNFFLQLPLLCFNKKYLQGASNHMHVYVYIITPLRHTWHLLTQSSVAQTPAMPTIGMRGQGWEVISGHKCALFIFFTNRWHCCLLSTHLSIIEHKQNHCKLCCLGEWEDEVNECGSLYKQRRKKQL